MMEMFNIMMLEKMRKLYDCCFMLDANCINAKQRIADINQLERWYIDDVIDLAMSETSSDEAAAGGDAKRERKRCDYISTLTYESTQEETTQINTIKSILFPEVTLTQNQENDVLLVFNALKYHYKLITTDGASRRQPGGILGNAGALKSSLGIHVMRPGEAVAFVRERIIARDQTIEEMSRSLGLPMPTWIGKD